MGRRPVRTLTHHFCPVNGRVGDESGNLLHCRCFFGHRGRLAKYPTAHSSLDTCVHPPPIPQQFLQRLFCPLILLPIRNRQSNKLPRMASISCLCFPPPSSPRRLFFTHSSAAINQVGTPFFNSMISSMIFDIVYTAMQIQHLSLYIIQLKPYSSSQAFHVSAAYQKRIWPPVPIVAESFLATLPWAPAFLFRNSRSKCSSHLSTSSPRQLVWHTSIQPRTLVGTQKNSRKHPSSFSHFQRLCNSFRVQFPSPTQPVLSFS